MTITHKLDGDGAPSSVPPSIGAHYTDTTTGDQYLSKGTSTVSDWVKMAKDQPPIMVSGPSSLSLDALTGQKWLVTLSQDLLVTIPEASVGTQYDLFLTQDAIGDWEIEWSEPIFWLRNGETAIDFRPGKVSQVSLSYVGENQWVGRIAKFGGKHWNEPVIALSWYDNLSTNIAIFNYSFERELPLLARIKKFAGNASGYPVLLITADSRYLLVTLQNHYPDNNSYFIAVIDTAYQDSPIGNGCALKIIPFSIAFNFGGLLVPAPYNRTVYLLSSDGGVYYIDLDKPPSDPAPLFAVLGTPLSVSGNGSEITVTYTAFTGYPDPVVGYITYDHLGIPSAFQYEPIPNYVAKLGDSSGPPSPSHCSAVYHPSEPKMVMLLSWQYLPDLEAEANTETRIVIYDTVSKEALFISNNLYNDIGMISSGYVSLKRSTKGKYAYFLVDAYNSGASELVLIVLDIATQTTQFLSINDILGFVPEDTFQVYPGINITVSDEGFVVLRFEESFSDEGEGFYKYDIATQETEYYPTSTIDGGWDGAGGPGNRGNWAIATS